MEFIVCQLYLNKAIKNIHSVTTSTITQFFMILFKCFPGNSFVRISSGLEHNLNIIGSLAKFHFNSIPPSSQVIARTVSSPLYKAIFLSQEMVLFFPPAGSLQLIVIGWPSVGLENSAPNRRTNSGSSQNIMDRP